MKWTGNKWKQAGHIVSCFPREIDSYYEPFLGSGAVLWRLLTSGVRVGRIECSDVYAPLIALWNLTKSDPDRLLAEYRRMWQASISGGEKHYLEVRRDYNANRCPVHLYFLLRTCWLGHVRLNAKGEFTSAYDGHRAGSHPDMVRGIVDEWHRKLNSSNVALLVRDYREVTSSPGDVLYLDPPYPTAERYYGRINYGRFFRWLAGQRGGYLLSLSGTPGDTPPRLTVPNHIYETSAVFNTDVAPFSRINGLATHAAPETLYLKSGAGGRPNLQPAEDYFEKGLHPGDYLARSLSHTSETWNRALGGGPIDGKGGRNVSEAIRSLLAGNPTITPSLALKVLSAQGFRANRTVFRLVRLNWRRQQGRRERQDRSVRSVETNQADEPDHIA